MHWVSPVTLLIDRTVYLPNHFVEERTEVLQALITAQPLGTLVTVQDGLPCADEVPFLFDSTAGPHGTLRAHVARANPLWQCAADTPVLVIFRGPQAYVSPSWYPSKAEHGKGVPTWNYVLVQARGRLRVIDKDPVWLRAQLDALTHLQESPRPQPWQVSDAPADYLSQMMRAIVGIEITLDSLVGKWKVSQNRTDAERAGVVAGLTAQKHEQAAHMAALVSSLQM
jgi:transcriptional regulator